MAQEFTSPEGKEAICWWLLTIIPVMSLEDTKRYIQWYGFRWLIERYHFVLKSGCRIERLQLKSAERLEHAHTLYLIIAWRLLWLTNQTRLSAEQICSYRL